MSNPSFTNIDRWLFERMEGNLTPEQEAQLDAFLLQHPELDIDKDMWELSQLNPIFAEYPHKNKLEKKRPVVLYFFASALSVAVILVLTFWMMPTKEKVNSIFMKDNSATTHLPKIKNDHNNSAETLKNNSQTTTGLNTKNYTVRNSVKETDINLLNTQSTKYLPLVVPQNTSNQELIDDKTIVAHTTNFLGSLRHASILCKKTTKGKTFQFNKTSGLSNKRIFITNDLTDEVAQKEEEDQNGKRFSLNLSFSSKFKKTMRSVKKMLDNPVALKNLKDPIYHLPGMQAMDINFGAVGTLLSTRVQTTSRAQWLGSMNQQFINQISLDAYAYALRGGIGFQMNHSYYGNGGIQNYNATFTYSPKFSIAPNFVLEPSIRFKMGTKQLKADLIETGSLVEYDRGSLQEYYADGSGPIGRTLWYRDLGAGLMLNSKWFFIGVQADNLLEHYDNIYSADLLNPRKAPRELIATIGTDYESKKRTMAISPYVVYHEFGDLKEFWAGATYRYHWFTVGAAMSSKYEPAASLGLKFKHFMVTYNADYTKSALLNKSVLSHQLTMRFTTNPCRMGQRLLLK